LFFNFSRRVRIILGELEKRKRKSVIGTIRNDFILPIRPLRLKQMLLHIRDKARNPA